MQAHYESCGDYFFQDLGETHSFCLRPSNPTDPGQRAYYTFDSDSRNYCLRVDKSSGSTAWTGALPALKGKLFHLVAIRWNYTC